MNHRLPIILLTLLLSACASNLPKTISDAPVKTASVAEVRNNIKDFTHREVRWGGTVASVTNFANHSEIEVVSRDLYKSGRPKNNDQSAGRFIAEVAEFIDPDVYKKDREVTIHGVISGSKNNQIGEYDYFYPLVKADALHLWAETKETVHPYDYYDPFFYPWFYRPGFGYYGRHFHRGHISRGHITISE